MADISSFLKIGWNNIWKNKSLWGFSFLILIEPVIRIFIPYKTNPDLPASFLDLSISIISLYLLFLSMAGISFISYCVAIEKTVSFKVAFQASKHILSRVAGLMFVLLLILTPLICAVFIYSFEYPPQITNFAQNFLLTSVPLAAFSAIPYFAITEMVVNDSKIGKSLKAAWMVFYKNFAALIFLGLLLAVTSNLINVIFGAGLMLAQNNFDFLSIKQLDFFSPHLSFVGNNFFIITSTFLTIFLRTYSMSVFTVAYLKYNGIKK